MEILRNPTTGTIFSNTIGSIIGGIGNKDYEIKRDETKTLEEQLSNYEDSFNERQPTTMFGQTADSQLISDNIDSFVMSEETQKKMIQINGSEGNDVIKASINEENGNIVININGEITEYTPEEAANGFKINLGDGNDSVDISAISNNIVIDAGEGNNNINLSQGRNFVTAGNGNNSITSTESHLNRIKTGNGNNKIVVNGDINTVTTGNGNDNITISGKDNKINSQDGTDVIIANGDKNNIDAGNGNDNITVGDGVNIINGGNGNDNINAGNGFNTINGGAGNDTINAGDGVNTINGDNGDDNITVGNGSFNTINGGDGNDNITAGNGNNTINGSDGNDNITVGNGNNDIYGEDGNDTITAGNGDNKIDGGKGNDKITAGDGENRIYGRDGKDEIKVGNGENYVEGGKGDDKITAGNGKNVIYGLDGKDEIKVGNGNNYIDGGKDNDTITTGTGKNTVFGGKGKDTITTISNQSTIYDDTEGTINAKEGNRINRYEASENENLGSSIKVEGDEEFQMRVESDLESMRHTRSGKKLISEIDKSGHTLTIKELKNSENGFEDSINTNERYKQFVSPDGKKGDGTDAVVYYNPAHNGVENGVPLTTLHHESVHAYNTTTGTMQPGQQKEQINQTTSAPVNKLERQCVGLPVEDGVEIKHRDGTVTTGNPKGLTENDMREDLGLEKRQHYNQTNFKTWRNSSSQWPGY